MTATSNPFPLFDEWYRAALSLDVKEPTAMTLATADKDGRPSARVVLLKAYDERGFSFFTNTTSRKGRELLENPQAALCFYWMQLSRQVRVEGKIELVSDKEADDYYASRSRGSQIGAWASKQSQVIQNEEELVGRVAEFTKQFEAGPVPRPPFWSGFRLVPEHIEFWEERPFRLHVRFKYSRGKDGVWQVARLFP